MDIVWLFQLKKQRCRVIRSDHQLITLHTTLKVRTHAGLSNSLSNFFESGLFKWRRIQIEHHGIYVVALDFCRSLYTAEKSCSGYKSLFVSFRLALFFGNFKLCSIVSCEGSESARDLADLFLPWECERWASGGSKFPLVSLLIFLLPTAICCCVLVLLLCRNPFAAPLLVLILIVCCLIEDAVCSSLSRMSRKAMLLLSL